MGDRLLGNLLCYNRLRIGTDGKGVTTLVAMHGCPLNCKYCINKDLYGLPVKHCSIEQLYEKMLVDDLYFSYTGGGVCFGGHEPLLQTDFIKEFILYVRSKDKPWKFTVETSLNVGKGSLEKLLDYIDCWVIDIKSMNADIYKSYTGVSNEKVIGNLRVIADQVHKGNVFIRIPRIKDFTIERDILNSVNDLKSMGFQEESLEVFDYVLSDLGGQQ